MGADALAHGVAMVAGTTWFSVRKEAKNRGRRTWIEGTRLSPTNRVLIVDDVATSGGSILEAYNRVKATGASIVGVIPMVDRSEDGKRIFAGLGVPYRPLATYRDFGIEPVNRVPTLRRSMRAPRPGAAIGSH